MKIYNKSKQLVEKAKFKQCPRCRGFGSVLGDDDGCEICNGYGRAWISDSGWTRAKHQKTENSKLY